MRERAHHGIELTWSCTSVSGLSFEDRMRHSTRDDWRHPMVTGYELLIRNRLAKNLSPLGLHSSVAW